MNIEKYTQNAQQAIMDCQNIAISEGHQMLDGATSAHGTFDAEGRTGPETA